MNKILIHYHCCDNVSALVAQGTRPKSRSRVNGQQQGVQQQAVTTTATTTTQSVNMPQTTTKVTRDESSTDDEKGRQVPAIQSVQRKQFVRDECVCV